MLTELFFADFLYKIYDNNKTLLNNVDFFSTEHSYTDCVVCKVKSGIIEETQKRKPDITYLDEVEKKKHLINYLLMALYVDDIALNYPQETFLQACQHYLENALPGFITSFNEDAFVVNTLNQYDLVAVALLDLFSDFLNDEDFEIFRHVFWQISQAEHRKIISQNLDIELQEIESKLTNFERDKVKEMAELQHDFRNLQQNILLLERRIEFFDQSKENEYAKLQRRKESILENKEPLKPKTP